MSPKFAYWPIQGRGTPSKMALAYAGVDYEDITYDFGAAEGADNHWGTQKSKLGLAFPNLPWFIDGNVKLTQSNAILRHIGRKHNLYGSNVDEASEIDMLIDTATDIQTAITKVVFDPDFDNLVVKLPETLEPKLQQLSDYIGDKKFLLGDSVTIADFPIYVNLEWNSKLDEKYLEKFPKLDNYLKNVQSDPKIKAYLNSDKHFALRVPPFAPGAKMNT
jgi:glutathione S-transferase